ncbi:ATP-binding protein [Streptomyces sp. NPDC052015]|uniref:sensor histidine kinase n=1 Tax=Streptomyces sp. NPDC052015 TaxID=3154755 RepID=UPI00343ACB07
MSHLRAPAARADRREGGRHGRPVARTAPAPAETHIRPQLLRLAVLPPTAVALSACAAVLFAVRSTGVRPGPTLWAVLAGALGVTVAGILIAAVAADRAARSVSDRIEALRRGSARGEADLRALLDTLRRGETPPRPTAPGGPPAGADEFELLAADLSRAHDGAVTAVVQAAQLSSQAGDEQKLEVFVNLARRLQSLVHREISILDELENEIEDPDLLKGLFHVDHLATRIRRHAENLAVLGGAVSRRQWSNPVSMTEVLRSAIAEVEQYSRVRLVPPIDGELRGHAVADVIHLLAELVENATVFSAPHTQVLLRANLVTSGLAVEVEDRGLGMPVEEQSRMNALLADPDQVNVGRLLADGRIGLYVVSQLARRHGIRVRLQTNIYGGVQAVLVVPQALLGSASGALVPQAEESGGGEAPPGDGARGSTPGAVRTQAQPPAPSGRQPEFPARSGTRPQAPVRAGGSRRPGSSRAHMTGPDRSATQPSAGTRTPSHSPVVDGSRTQAQLPGDAQPSSEVRPEAQRRSPVLGAAHALSEVRSEPQAGPQVPGADLSQVPGAGLSQVPGAGLPQVLGGGAPRTADGGLSQVPNAALPQAPGAALPQVQGGGAAQTPDSGLSQVPDSGLSQAPGGVQPPFPGQRQGGSPPAPELRAQTPAAAPPTTPRTEVPTAGPTRPDEAVTAVGRQWAGAAPARSTSEEDRSSSGTQTHGVSGGERPPLTAPAVPPARARHDTPRPHGGGPAPLPVRGAHEERPNPAEAVPGIRPGDRSAVEEHAGHAPVPRVSAVRGTMGKPRLPRRRAQEHIAPQLRGGPAPRQDAEQYAGHDPGLMAAFLRGTGLAEAQQNLETQAPPPAPYGTADPVSDAHPAHTPASPEAYRAAGPDHHPTTRHDGSTPAG